MDQISLLLGDYYGIDWLTLFIGLTGSYMMSGGRLRLGFTIGIFSCLGGLALAVLSHQYGFIVYNALLIGLNIRGIMRNGRRASDRQIVRKIQIERANDLTPVPVKIAA